ncbi:MAG: HIT domain-containing protein [Ignavibacteriales bacterium]|nr:HIT domain-containing protein [Ignavibacteriales bacterium]
MSCIFCDIITRKIPAEILYENECALSILDINPIHYGHALIIPKRHHRDFLEVGTDELSGIMQAVHTVSHALVKAFKLEGFNFFANNGAVAGQSVFHFHIHVTPRYHNDNIRFVLHLKRYEMKAMEETAAIIRSAITDLSMPLMRSHT